MVELEERKESELTLEEKKKKVSKLRPIDDVFFEVLAEDEGVCEEILRTILKDPSLTVKDVIVQSSKRNLYGRSVRLDALCVLGNGEKCNIEVQRSDSDNRLKRIRFNASVITTKDSQTAERFKDVGNLYVVFISENDFIGGGKTIYHVDSVLRETGKVVDDGLRRILVNAKVDDGSEIAELMQCFLQCNVESKKFKRLTKRAKYLKEEGGVDSMCAVMKEYEDIARAEGKEEGREEGILEGAIKGTIETLVELNSPETRIIDKIMEKFDLTEKVAREYISQYA